MTKGIVEPAITEADVYAFRALAEGSATADQQKRVGNWLLTEGARVFSDPYTEVREAGSETSDDVLFALGRRHVGILMREMLMPTTLDKARRLSAALHPDHQDTPSSPTPARKLQDRRRSRREPK